MLFDTSAWVEFPRNTVTDACDLMHELLAGARDESRLLVS